MLPTPAVLKECITEGVRQGLFGYGLGDAKDEQFDAVHWSEPLSVDAVDLVENAWLLRPEYARSVIARLKGEAPPQPPVGPTVEPVPPGPKVEGAPSLVYKTVAIEGDLDWKKWADFYDGVIKPLIQAGASVRVRVRADGVSESGIPRNVVKISIKESNSQRGLNVRVSSNSDQKDNDPDP